MSRADLAAARERLLPLVEAALRHAVAGRAAERRLGPAPAVPDDARGGEHALSVSPAASAYFGMMGYHFGWLDERLRPAAAPTGKRLRPLICVLAAEACGGVAAQALPAAVALELLHNFTLIHDDIEDGDAVRHHRPTVWKVWGEAQAINAGDGMHVLAYLALFSLAEHAVAAPIVVRLAERLAQTSLAITEGQHLDLAFEGRDDVSPAEYLDMIARKSATLLGCAAAAGAEVAGAPPAQVEALAAYGHQLGLGFQVRDDVLGIWGEVASTGKPARDLYRRKKTLPVLYALSHAAEPERATLRALLAAPEPDDALVVRALAALDASGARRHCEQMVARYSAAARARLAPLPPSAASRALAALAAELETRDR